MKDCCGGECPCPSPSLQPVPQSQVFGTAEFKEHYPVGQQGRRGRQGKRAKKAKGDAGKARETEEIGDDQSSQAQAY